MYLSIREKCYFCPILTKVGARRQILEKKIGTRNFIKIRPATVAWFHANTRADTTRLAVTFGFVKTPKMSL